ncbi:OmpA family protein [Bradyrhizobium sp.]|uniref:OmpA family protein n=1 Tax=Bradyrhizobium sp. TaxID=376 RepID=UPI0027369078|nr:OmpA family protein [Bradyrhizobium sp.]MDP3075741.1 OmpA family protein [Bradyrhizobium sp.]
MRALTVVAGGFLLFAGCGFAGAAERASESQILNALKPPPLARALTATPSPKDVKRQAVVRNLRSVTRTRALTGDERNELASIAKDRPSIDLEIYFDFNSSEIASKAVPDLMNLGRALTNAELQGGVYLLSGHTDAKGGEDYNQRLSERRAQSVKDFLVRKFRISDDTLVTAGYGEEQLKNTSDPLAGENRRVQVTNLETKQEAGR